MRSEVARRTGIANAYAGELFSLVKMSATRSSSPNVHGTAASPALQDPLLESPSAASGPDEVSKEEVQNQLGRILASSSFKNSRRHTHFLRFLVEKCLSGKAAEIKERLIGIEVFDRAPDYDATTDPIVRGAAVELRKRIAQYYAETEHAGELRLEIPLGNYVPVFHWPNAQHKEDMAVAEAQGRPSDVAIVTAVPSPQKPEPETRVGWRRWTRTIVVGSVAAIAAIAALLAIHYLETRSAQRSLAAFWAPLMDGGDSITVCVGDLNYLFKTPPLSNMVQLHPAADNLLNPNAGVALLRVGSILGSRGKHSTFRLADLTELNDLRQQPVVFVGGMNNQWTQRILGGLRFRLMSIPGGINGNYGVVIDGKNPAANEWRVDIFAPLSSIDRDYSLVTRMNDPLTGEPVVILGGLGPYGTAAASDFVSNPEYFSQFSQNAPKGWESRNIQIVLETSVVNGRVSVPRVVAQQVY